MIEVKEHPEGWTNAAMPKGFIKRVPHPNDKKIGELKSENEELRILLAEMASRLDALESKKRK